MHFFRQFPLGNITLHMWSVDKEEGEMNAIELPRLNMHVKTTCFNNTVQIKPRIIMITILNII